MLPSSLLARASAAGLGAALIVLAAFEIVGCGSAPRLGGAGESCTKTADCESPLSCVSGACKGSGGQGGGGGGSTSADSVTSVTVTAGGPLTWNDCDGCLDVQCKDQEAACDPDCLAVEACIETVCPNLSAIGAAVEEGKCQAQCEAEHPGAKAPLIAVVNCANGAACMTCQPYPADFDGCVAFMTKGACKDAQAACAKDPNCTTYKDCTAQCMTAADCAACDDKPAGLAGRHLLEAYQICLATECTAEAWLP